MQLVTALQNACRERDEAVDHNRQLTAELEAKSNQLEEWRTAIQQLTQDMMTHLGALLGEQAFLTPGHEMQQLQSCVQQTLEFVSFVTKANW